MKSSHSAGNPTIIARMSVADCAKRRGVELVVGALLLPAVLSAYFWAPGEWQAVSLFQQNRVSSDTTSTVRKDELETALEGASMENKTLIITVVNKAYTEKDGMLDLFLHSFQLGEDTSFLLNHTLLVVVDQRSFNRCNILQLHCYKLVTDGVDFSGEKLYMSDEFIRMMWSRTLFLGDVLKRGYNFIFTDTDVMWLRNPFPLLRENGQYDLQISCDKFNGQPFDEHHLINTGFYYVRSSNKTIAFFDMWYESRNNSMGMKEQDALIQLVSRGVLRQLGIQMRILDTRYMSGFCEISSDFQQVITMHANCCRTIKAKLIDLGEYLEDWKNFRAYLEDWKNFREIPDTVITPRLHKACFDSWKNFNITNNGVG